MEPEKWRLGEGLSEEASCVDEEDEVAGARSSSSV
jgi:hypothetical protein